jgi:anti-sigma factor RsiW
MVCTACILARYTWLSSGLADFLGPQVAWWARIMNHVPDDWLDQYSRGTLDAARLAQVEEHLLICEQCRERLTKLDDTWGLNG